MNLPAATSTETTMTLKEITDLLEVRHDKAMITVLKMAKYKGFGTVSKMDIVYNDKGQTIETLNLNRRQSMAVAARLNTDLLMKVIDRLDELENAPALTYEEIMQQALTMADQKVKALTCENEELKPKAAGYERIAIADGSLCITDAAKALQVQPKKVLFPWLQLKKWIYRRAGGQYWLGYQDKVQQGLLEHKVTTQLLPDGTERMREQVLITPKGLAKLSDEVLV